MKEKTVSLVEQTANRIVEYFEKNDLKALQSDWEKVGNDIRNAMSEYDKQYKVGK